MKLVNWSAALTFAALIIASGANAADARLSDCIHLGKQAAAAVESAQPGNRTDQAKVEIQAGRTYCASQMYAQGVAHYSKALQLLGKG